MPTLKLSPEELCWLHWLLRMTHAGVAHYHGPYDGLRPSTLDGAGHSPRLADRVESLMARRRLQPLKKGTHHWPLGSTPPEA
jgi:hypothetical protein